MILVYERVWVGNDDDCRVAQRAGLATVHACKTCHQQQLKYEKSLPADHPHYLSVQDVGSEGSGLFLNLIDPPIPLFKLQSFEIFLKFASERYGDGEALLIHCNQGLSRAPSLALLFLSKRLGVIGNGSFKRARTDFEDLYPQYNPGKGIEMFLKEHWKEL